MTMTLDHHESRVRKVTAATIAKILRMLAAGHSLTETSLQCDVSKSTVWLEAKRAGVTFVHRRAGSPGAGKKTLAVMPTFKQVILSAEEELRASYRRQAASQRWGWSYHSRPRNYD